MKSADIFTRVIMGPSLSQCWPWAGAVDTRGYGHFRDGRRIVRAHRAAYEHHYGPIECGEGHHGQVVMHKCDNRLCCNPSHMKLGSHADNMADMAAKGRRKAVGAGESNGRAVLSLQQVVLIREDKRSQRAIAREYEVSKAAIQRIKAGKAWATA
jgi:hypothetical protein